MVHYLINDESITINSIYYVILPLIVSANKPRFVHLTPFTLPNHGTNIACICS